MNQSYYPSQDPMLKFQQEMKIRKFSPGTVKSYLYYITDILKYSNKNPKPVNSEDIRSYLKKMADSGASGISKNSWSIRAWKPRKFIPKLPTIIYKPSKVR